MSQVHQRYTARHLYLIAIGSNAASCWGPPLATVKEAQRQLEQALGPELVASDCFATPAFPAGVGPDFVNAAARVESGLSPEAMLDLLHGIEQQALRQRNVRWGQRTLDLDLIAADDLVLPDPQTYAQWRDLPLAAQMEQTPAQLILPHPRMHERAFVLVPLAQIAGDWRHPATGQSVLQMRDACASADLASVKLL